MTGREGWPHLWIAYELCKKIKNQAFQNYVNTYVYMSRNNVNVIFDEINAYTHELKFRIEMANKLGVPFNASLSPGLQSMMIISEIFFDAIRLQKPEALALMTADPRFQSTTQAIWNEAILTLNTARNTPGITLDSSLNDWIKAHPSDPSGLVP